MDYLSNIYIKPRYFDTLINDLCNGASRFIFGDRGSGKSALIIELKKELESNNIFSIIIQNYDDIPLKNNDKHMIYLMIQELLKQLVVTLSKNPFLIKKLNRYEKEKLAIFIRDFYDSISRREYEDAFNKISKFKTKNILKNIFNTILNKPINIAISSGIEISSDLICKSFNLPKDLNSDFYKKYIPDLEMQKINKKKKEEYFLSSYKLLKDMLLELISIIKKIGFNNTVIFFDRIDEFKALDGKINNIVDFTVQILKDTDLLYSKELSLVFSVWNDIRRKLNGQGIRFDKFKPIDVSWTNEDTLKILEKRLSYFAIKKPYRYNEILENETCFSDLIHLVNQSPRDLIRLFSTIYDEQDLLKISNAISCIIMMDQSIVAKDKNIMIRRLNEIVQMKDKLPPEKMELIIEWLKKVLSKRFPEEEAIKIIKNLKEGKSMTYAIERLFDNAEEKIRMEEKVEVVKAGLSEGLPVDLIKKLTGLDIEKIQEIEKEIKH